MDHLFEQPQSQPVLFLYPEHLRLLQLPGPRAAAATTSTYQAVPLHVENCTLCQLEECVRKINNEIAKEGVLFNDIHHKNLFQAK